MRFLKGFWLLYNGSALNQVWKNYFGSTSGKGDEDGDVYMFQTGIYYYKFLIKK